MRVIPFPTRREETVDPAVLAELEAAFDGDGTGPQAEAWRELRADVRSLPAPIDAAFQSSLEQQLRRSRQRPRGGRRLTLALRGGRLRGQRLLAAGTAVVLLAALVFAGAALTSGGGRSGTIRDYGKEASPLQAHRAQGEESDHGPVVQGPAATGSGESAGTVAGPDATFGPAEERDSGAAPGESAKRLQQLGATISLGGGQSGVQAVADRVGDVAVSAGGYVVSSKVELQHGAAGEAALTLSVPSAKLASTLATLQRLAPVRAETQELQDLTGHYDAVAARLAAARAEREALLRALAGAESAAAVESLHLRIARANAAIAAAERQEAKIAHTASEAQIEVEVVGETAHAGGGLTIGRGLHDAGHVLTVLGAVLLIALAVIIPLGLLIAALWLAARVLRRYQRERALGSG
ncbi:MAG TPA: DUF4349 domain-containing protein [Solirubrobacteraceae bacterium]|nr:DUF4349 domain-containing protein [Solirubrobacteraceae bacterium]